MSRIPNSSPRASNRRALATVGLLLVCAWCVPSVRADTTAKVQPSAPSPRFDGWGTSLCWFGNAVGRWSEPQRSEIADLLFSPGGLGLTVVRYNIGGGEVPGHHHMPAFRQMEGFQSASGEWNWDADPGQRWFLQAAIKRGANILEAFSNSPPYWMTVSQCASGNGDGKTDNLDPRFHTAFADYLAEVTKHFHDAWGISFQTLDPFNESASDYWRVNGKQEGCHFDHAIQAALIKLTRASLDARGLKQTQIAASDETNFASAIESFKAYDPATQALVGQINTHAYATERRAELSALAQKFGKVLVMSEVDGAGGTSHDHGSMVPALELANRIIGDLKELHPTQWTFWQTVEDEDSQATGKKNWGLIHADLKGQSQAYTLTKKYHAMASFTRFIRPGQVFLPVDNENTVAAFDPTKHTLVLVTRNAAATDARVSYDLSAFSTAAGPIATYRTSASENVARLPDTVLATKTYTATIPAGSITTLVIGGVTYTAQPTGARETR